MTKQHTPGPWSVTGPYHYASDLRPVYRIDADVLVATVGHHDGPDETNAHLIAAAPDMLAALIESHFFAEHELQLRTASGDKEYIAQAAEIVESTRAAIAKATGAQS